MSRCAQITRQLAEPMAGTAPSSARWLCLEWPDAWPADIKQVDDPAARRLLARATAAGFRPLLVRGRRPTAGPAHRHVPAGRDDHGRRAVGRPGAARSRLRRCRANRRPGRCCWSAPTSSATRAAASTGGRSSTRSPGRTSSRAATSAGTGSHPRPWCCPPGYVYGHLDARRPPRSSPVRRRRGRDRPLPRAVHVVAGRAGRRAGGARRHRPVRARRPRHDRRPGRHRPLQLRCGRPVGGGCRAGGARRDAPGLVRGPAHPGRAPAGRRGAQAAREPLAPGLVPPLRPPSPSRPPPRPRCARRRRGAPAPAASSAERGVDAGEARTTRRQPRPAPGNAAGMGGPDTDPVDDEEPVFRRPSAPGGSIPPGWCRRAPRADAGLRPPGRRVGVVAACRGTRLAGRRLTVPGTAARSTCASPRCGSTRSRSGWPSASSVTSRWRPPKSCGGTSPSAARCWWPATCTSDPSPCRPPSPRRSSSTSSWTPSPCASGSPRPTRSCGWPSITRPRTPGRAGRDIPSGAGSALGRRSPPRRCCCGRRR